MQSMTLFRILGRTIFLLFITLGVSQSAPYYGSPLGSFTTVSNNVKGDVFAVDAVTLFVKDFSYDERSQDAVFWAGSSEHPDANGFALTNETSEMKTIHPYNNHNVILRLPNGKNLKDIRWLSVWNRILSKSLGTLIFSKMIQPPEPMSIGPLVNTKNGVATGDILILDTQTFLVPLFNYDGSAKETYWWLSKGKEPDERGVPLLENGSDAPLEETMNRTVVITLPRGHFVGDYETLSVWNRIDGDNYGFVAIPKNINVPPSSHILGTEEPEMTDFNCEMLNDKLNLEVRWVIRGYDAIIYLIGNIGPNEYMALGLSKDDAETRFESADAMVVGLDDSGKAFATDYFFESNQKCENAQGMCPDSIHGSENNIELLYAERYQNSTTIIIKRHLRAEDNVYDQNIYTDGPQAILWAVGSLLPNGFIATPTFHNQKNVLMDFGRGPSWNCPTLQKRHPFIMFSEPKRQHIHCPGERSFRAQIGSSYHNNEKKVWFINGIPTPELTVQRGNTYTFFIEGGLKPPNHHPFYITNSKEGGMYRNILEANETLEVVFAGIQEDHDTREIFPTAEGRLCDWTYSDITPEYTVFTPQHAIKPTLVLKCEPGEPGKLVWTPTAETPDEVYYQSFTERNLGGKIHVVDFCEETNPHRYLEISTKGGNSRLHPPSPQKDDLERESEIDEYDLFLSMEDQMPYARETRIKHQEERKSLSKINSTTVYKNYLPDKYALSSNIINSFKLPSGNNERINKADDNQVSESTTSLVSQMPGNPDELFPHDESERSDAYLPHQKDFREATNHNTLNSQRNNENSANKYPTHSASQISSVPALENQPLQEFRPHFEGGFVPLVMNPIKEKEFVQTKEFIYPSQHNTRPRRPFLYNESVPFHGTFKPGVPDFSGFNISNYSQEDASIIMAPNQDNLSFLSASRPQPVHTPFSPFGTIPLHLLQRPKNQPSRHQRPQDIGHRFQQPSTLVGMRQNIFSHLSPNKNSNLPISNVRDEDLAGISSQRVYVSMQAAGDKNVNSPNFPNSPISSAYNRNQKNQSPNKVVYPPPIQRRPDFYEGKELNIRPPNTPQRNFNAPHNPANVNKHNQQTLNIPVLQSGRFQGQANIRPQMPNSKVLMKHLQGQGDHIMIQQGPLRHPYSALQGPSRDRIPQVPLLPKGVPVRPTPQIDEKLKMVDGSGSPPQHLGKVLPFPLHMLKQNEKVPQDSKEPQIVDLPSSKENRHMPQLINAELVEVLNKNIPTTSTKENPSANPMLLQTLPFNESLNTYFRNTDIRIPHSVLNQNHPSLPFGKMINQPAFPIEPGKSENIFKTEEIASLERKNKPLNSNYQENFEQKSNNERNKQSAQKIMYESHQNVESRPSDFQQVVVKPVLETSVPADMSSSNSPKTQLPTVLDYESEIDDADSSDSSSVGDYSSYNVPFGARLKFPQNGSKIPVKTLNETPKRPFGITRKPERNEPKTIHRNPNGSVKPTDSIIRTTTTSTTSTSTSTTTEAALIVMESMSHSVYNNKQNSSSEKEDFIKSLYYTPPLSSLPKNPDFINSSTNLYQNNESNEVKHIPIIADRLEGIVEASYPGRKNILPNSPNSAVPPFVFPPRESEDINLPQISENPPTHDNRTDYSILNHILTLIGGPPESKSSASSY